MLRRALAALFALAALVPAASAGGTETVLYPRCFGAASRAPRHPCHNPRLRLAVVPSPRVAGRLPNAPCAPVDPHGFPYVCRFGARRELAARRDVALIGDSHATVWRAALGPVAERRRWRGWSLTRAACPYSFAAPLLPERLRPECIRWRNAIPRWFRAHPQVGTVILSAHRVRVVVPPGRNRLATEVAGYESAWAALPATVRRIVVIRDTPANRRSTRGCVIAAIERRRAAGPACAIPRGEALQTDPEAVAAQRMEGPRVRLIDMSRFMCDRRRCFPVVGGALVYRNLGHISATFGATMAPFLGTLMQRALR